MSEVTVTISGPVGSGKSAIAGEIEILCKALGLRVEWDNSQPEKNMTHADWTGALEMYKPSVRIVETISTKAAYRRCGQDLARLRAMLDAQPAAAQAPAQQCDACGEGRTYRMQLHCCTNCGIQYADADDMKANKFAHGIAAASEKDKE